VTQEPFVWEVHVRRELVEDEVAKLRALPYSVWREAIGTTRTKTVVGRDSRDYTATVRADFVEGSGGDIRVTLTLEGPGLRRAPLQDAFVVAPDYQAR
jgi:hypothetical protein